MHNCIATLLSSVHCLLNFIFADRIVFLFIWVLLFLILFFFIPAANSDGNISRISNNPNSVVISHEFLHFLSASGDPSLATSFGVGGFRGDLKHRTIVCRHFLLGLCQNGYSCGYLHRLDKKKMPACKHGGLCKIKNCLLKHTDEQEVSECIFYKQVSCEFCLLYFSYFFIKLTVGITSF